MCRDSTGSLTPRVITLPEYRDKTPFSETRQTNLLWFDDDSVDRLDRVFSEKHQWLPTDFEVSATGRVRPLGYINNLHPIDHREAYATLSAILERFLPLFEHVVSDALSPARPYAIQVNGYEWYERTPRSPSTSDSEKAWRTVWERRERWPRIPDPAPFEPPSTQGRVFFPLKGRTLQVVVKLANIVLMPENPKYPGGR